jgi:predicted nucleotide-binding protein
MQSSSDGDSRMHIEADPQVRIIKNRAPPQRPLVSVTVRASGTQVRIAFNAELVRQASLQDVLWMAIEFDGKRQRVTFISTLSREYQGPDDGYPLLPDGGRKSRKTAAKALTVPTDLFSMLYRQAPRHYEPQIQPGPAGPKISIDLEPAPASYADSEAWLGGGGQTEAKRRAAVSIGKRSIEAKRPNVFVGSSTEGLSIAEAIQVNLDHEYEVTLWSQDDWLGKSPLEALVRAAATFDFAVLVLTPDDLVMKREKGGQQPRDNVLFELGLFMGKLGRERTFIVHERIRPLDLPTDLAGITPATFARRDNMRAALGPVCTQLKTAMIAARPK